MEKGAETRGRLGQKGEAAGYIVLALITFIAYHQILQNGFVNLDDPLQFTANRNVLTGITWKNILWSFSFESPCSPLTWLIYAAAHSVFGLKPGPFHAISLLLHISASLVLFHALRRITGAYYRSFMVSILFAVHPINVESVAWIAEVNNVLSGLFFALTLLVYHFYTKKPDFKRYLLLVVTFELGLLSKSVLMTVPFLLLLLDYWPLKRLVFERASSGKSIRLQGVPILRLIGEKMPLLCLSLISLISGLLMQPKHTAFTTFTTAPMSLRINNALVTYVKYLGKLFWPHDLGVLYPYPKAIPPMETAGAVLCLLIVTCLALRLSRKSPYFITGWLWFLGMLVPFLGIIQSGLWPEMADRYAYLPFIGIFIVLTWGTHALVSSLQSKALTYALYALSGIIVCALTAATWHQTGYWKDSVTLFGHVLSINPENGPAHGNLGAELLNLGEIRKAIPHFQESLRMRPSEDACFNLGMAYYRIKNNERALQYFRQALQINSNDAGSYNFIGTILVDMGKMDEGIVYFKEAAARAPREIEAYMNLGNAMFRTGHMDEALSYYQEAISNDPACAEAYNNIGTIYAIRKDSRRARENFQRALQIRPDYAEAMQNLGRLRTEPEDTATVIAKIEKAIQADSRNPVLFIKLAGLHLQRGDTDEAIRNYSRAVSLKQDSVEARYGLVQSFSRKQDYAEAIKVMQEIQALQPDNPETYYNLACVYSKGNHADESIKYLRKAVDMGFSNWDLIRKDPDLANVRDRVEVIELLTSHKG